MENPFAIAMQWPDDLRRYVVHLKRPYFTAAIYETASAAWLLVSWAPGSGEPHRADIFRAAARFCSTQLDQECVPIEFVERKHGHHLPPYLMAQTPHKQLFIVEPDHSAPLVEVHDRELAGVRSRKKVAPRFDVITQWRLAEMRKYYRQFLERQSPSTSHAVPAVSEQG
jgi:hypothetical protein